MTRNNLFRRLIWSLASALLGIFLVSQATAAVLSISQTPLFITISMPSNITVLLDDSGSMEWAHAPDWYGSGETDWLYIPSPGAPAQSGSGLIYGTVNPTLAPLSGTVVASSAPLSGTVTATPVTSSTSVTVAPGTPLSELVTATSAPISTPVLVGGTSRHWTFSCPAGYNESSPWTGTSSSSSNTVPSGDTCTKPNYNYSCASSYTLTGPTSGSSSTGSGDTCTLPQYNYSCASGYALTGPTSGSSSSGSGDTCTKVTSYTYTCPTGYNQSSPWTSSGSTSTSFGTDTCTKPNYAFTCASGYTQSTPWTSSGTTATSYGSDTCSNPNNYTYACSSGYTQSTPWTGNGSTTTSYGSDTCSKTGTVYSCWPGNTSTGSGSSMKCIGWIQFVATINISSDSSSGGVYAPDTDMYKCACWNPLAYDPTQTYSPGFSDTGTLLTTSFTAAYVDPYVTSNGTVNLSTSYEATVDYDPSTTATSLMTSTEHKASDDNDEVNSCNNVWSFSFSSYGGTNYPTCQTVHNPQTAFYYTYTPTSSYATTNGCTNSPQDERCLTKVVVSTTSSPSGGDERQNFANWFSFYRTRNLTTNTSANRAFSGLGTTFRVAWRDLNTCTAFASTGCKGWSSTPSSGFDNRIATFSGTHRTNFFDWLKQFPANGGTPLRGGLQSIGAYYQTTGLSSPYAFNPQVTDTPEYVCRPNYAVIMTDGLWNDSGSPSPSVGNADNTAYTLPDNTSFAAGTHPYSDSTSSTMADVAFYYWSHNLRSDLGTSTALQYMQYTKAVTVTDSTNHTASLIPYWNPANDPASWPHMITFTVGLGLTTTITSPSWSGSTYAGGYGDLVTGNVAWPAATSNSANNVYDLWHTAINSRGQFFSADSPQDVQTAFNDIVTRIQGRVGSSSAIAVNSTRLDSTTFIYQAQFNSGGWTGEVLAFPINTDGSIGDQAWAASSLIPAASSRSIYSWDDTLNSGKGGAMSFLWSSLNATEKTNLNTNLAGTNDGDGTLRLNYLRGDQTDEQSQSGIFRTRADLLGDIVNSNPEYVGAGDFGDTALPGSEGSSYAAFVSGKSSRTPMLYVGANDGMMHGFNANTGVEVFDYVPRGVYSNLSALTDPDYAHEYYVDGSDIAVDAYISGAWKTLLVGSTGAGAKEIFLMDVSNPSTFSTTSVLWDYDGGTNGDANMGYSIPSPTIARMHDGDWYVIFGNGYNSTNQHAIIYMYNIRTATILKFDTGVGSVATPNGMSAPNPIDYDGDRIVDAIYAGDLQGNVWKLDVSNASSSNWKYYVYASSGSTPKPLFSATDSSGNMQPITDRVQVGLNSSGQVMAYFGTGTYFETNDNTVPTNPPVMSFYGIIDDLGNKAADQAVRSNLLEQYVVAQSTVNGNNFRVTTSYPMSGSQQGWFIDLNYPTAQGERVVSDAVLDNGRIIFTTLIPQGNACQFGGVSWLMELNSSTGGSLTSISPFDVNGDGKVNSNDYVTVSYTDPVSGKTVNATVPVGGIESNVGIIKTPGIVTSGNMQYKYSSGSTGSIMMTPESAPTTGGRISWQQIQ